MRPFLESFCSNAFSPDGRKSELGADRHSLSPEIRTVRGTESTATASFPKEKVARPVPSIAFVILGRRIFGR